MEKVSNKAIATPKYPPKNWTAKRAAAYGYIFTQDTTSTTITRLIDKATFIGDKIIPDSINDKPVTSIGGYAFYRCYGLTNVTIPSSVTSIGERAFWGCSELTNIDIPSSVTSIGDSTFSGCTGLTSISIPSSVTSIGDDVFYRCTGLTSITIPSSVTSIGDDAFYRCTGLTCINIAKPANSLSGAPGNAPKATVNWDYKG